MKSVTASHLVCDVTRGGDGISLAVSFESVIILGFVLVQLKSNHWSMAQWCQCIHQAPGSVPSTTETNMELKSNYHLDLGSWSYPSKL